MKPLFSIFLILAAQAAHAGDSNMQANGIFEVKLDPQTSSDSAPWGRQRIEKAFHGALEGQGIGEMLAVQSDVKGSAGYVALERVTATLADRKGSFFLQRQEEAR